MKDDKRAEVRKVVANNLLNAYQEGTGLPDILANTFLDFTNDPDEDIRWSIFYDVAEFPEYFKNYKELFKTACINAKKNPEVRVQEQAHRAFTALESVKSD